MGAGLPDAVVIGAGHNGLVAANLLADEGWSVVVLEAQPEPGGAVRSGELTLAGFNHDVFSAFYPLAAVSPVLARLELDRHGLDWRRSELTLAHPTPDGRAATLSTDIDITAASLDAYSPGDGDAWRRLYSQWERVGESLVASLLSPIPPIRPSLRLARDLGLADGLRFVRFAILPLRRMLEEEFSGEGARLLLGGNAGHVDIAPEAAGSALFGWLLACLGQQVGFPVPHGGSSALTTSLVNRLEAAGGALRCSTPVQRIVLRRGRAVAVITADGDEIEARRAVLADVGAPALFHDLVGTDFLPGRMVDDLRRFHTDTATVKVDWALDGPVPWTAEGARRAATIHVADDLDELTMSAAQVATGTVPDRPFLVFGQPGLADPGRCPPGREAAWAYTHVPQKVRADAAGVLKGTWDDDDAALFADRVEARIERLAPGFRDLIAARHILTPGAMQDRNANLTGGGINGGTAQLHQQLILRPTPGLGRPNTPFAGLFLASASAHPGGGVHGACGANAAHAALVASRRGWSPTRRIVNRVERTARGY